MAMEEVTWVILEVGSSLKQIRLKLDYMASTYGIDELIAAYIEVNDEGNLILVLEGERKNRG